MTYPTNGVFYDLVYGCVGYNSTVTDSVLTTYMFVSQWSTMP